MSRHTMSRDGAAERPAVETELKLGLDEATMEALLGCSVVREHARSEVAVREMHAVYHDTPDRRLHAHGAVLRVRFDGKGFVQTLKAPPADGPALLARSEWEVEVPDWQPRPEAFADPAALDLTGHLLPGELEPVFETRYQRRLLLLEWRDADGQPALVELAFDQGRIKAGEHETPISELELELKGGSPAVLFALAEALRAHGSFRIAPLDKSQRGWNLALGNAPGASKAEPIRLRAGQRIDDVLAEVLGSGLRHWLANEPAAMEAAGVEGVHQLRVSLRRLRSAFSLFRPAIGAEAAQAWSLELRWLLSELGRTRDLDVLTTGLLPPLMSELGADEPVLAFEALAQERRAQARAQMLETLRSQRYADLAFRFAAWTTRHGWRDAADEAAGRQQRAYAEDFATDVLDRRYRAVRKRGRRFQALEPAARHELRIAFKKLRYGIDFFAQLFPAKKVARFRDRVAAMQDGLGHLNDVDVAGRLVDDLVQNLPKRRAAQAAIGGGKLVGWYAHQLQELEPDAHKAWKAFRAAKPFWDGA